MLPNENLDTKNLNLTHYLFGTKNGEYYSMSIWETGADDWCDCQDYPDDYWKLLTLNNFKFEKDMVAFYWSWGDKNEKQYEMKAIKEAGKWKISHMQGFNSYTTVAGYKKIIQDIEKK